MTGDATRAMLVRFTRTNGARETLDVHALAAHAVALEAALHGIATSSRDARSRAQKALQGKTPQVVAVLEHRIQELTNR